MTDWTPYCGAAPAPAELMARWNFDPVLIAALALLMLVLAKLPGHPAPYRRAAFTGVAIVLAAVFVSPLCALSSALFAVRASHHLLLAAAAAPLLAWALPRREGAGAGILLGWTVAKAGAFWVWHVPLVYAAALDNDALYWAMQVSLIAAATGFWHAVREASAPIASAALIATTLQMGLLGALITLAPQPLYAPHLLTTAAWGLTPLEDQQLAGLIMWIPGSLVYLVAVLWLLGRSLLAQPSRA